MVPHRGWLVLLLWETQKARAVGEEPGLLVQEAAQEEGAGNLGSSSLPGPLCQPEPGLAWLGEKVMQWRQIKVWSCEAPFIIIRTHKNFSVLLNSFSYTFFTWSTSVSQITLTWKPLFCCVRYSSVNVFSFLLSQRARGTGVPWGVSGPCPAVWRQLRAPRERAAYFTAVRSLAPRSVRLRRGGPPLGCLRSLAVTAERGAICLSLYMLLCFGTLNRHMEPCWISRNKNKALLLILAFKKMLTVWVFWGNV